MSLQSELITTSTKVIKHETSDFEIVAYVTDSNSVDERGVWINVKVTADFAAFMDAMGEVMNEVSIAVAENGTVAKP